jgi:hypothetical protein
MVVRQLICDIRARIAAEARIPYMGPLATLLEFVIAFLSAGS